MTSELERELANLKHDCERQLETITQYDEENHRLKALLDEEILLNGKGSEREAKLLGQVSKLEAENARLRDLLNFTYRWVERGLYEETTGAENALKCIQHYDGAWWNLIPWDVRHKDYADRFYTENPQAKQALSEGGEDD